MKKSLLILLLAAAGPCFAQTAPAPTSRSHSINPRLDKKEQNGFTIILKPAIRNTYLFSVYQNGKMLHAQMRHPVNRSAVGFATRKDAYKAVGWAIAQYQQAGVFPDIIPPNVAAELQLSLNTMQH